VAPPSLSEGAITGGICYALAWLLAGAFRRRDPAPSAPRASLESESRAKDLIGWVIAGAVAGSLLRGGMQLGVTLGDPTATSECVGSDIRMAEAAPASA
jgi:hypothetical protein